MHEPAVAFNALTLGRHTVEVRAVDTSSNVDATPARYNWTVDAAPETTINKAVDGRAKSIANGGSTPSDTMTFYFTGADNGAVTKCECLTRRGSIHAVPESRHVHSDRGKEPTDSVSAPLTTTGSRTARPRISDWTKR